MNLNNLLAGLESVVRDDLAKICLSHHEDDLFNFDKYQINRVYGDDPEGEANLHYAALILRTADVLQIQKKRVPPVLYKLIDPCNPKSQEEWAKQAGVRAVRPKVSTVNDNGEGGTIEVHASFERERAYFGLLAYLQQYAGKELERCYDWAKLAQKKGATFRFPWKYIDSSQVEPRGFEGRSYSFRLDQEKILKLLTGHTLYNDSRVAIREVLQNALDAVRYRKYLYSDEPMGRIDVIWNSTERKLVVRDTGTGMTQEIIEKFLLNVGSSFYQSETVLQQHTGFSAISRFGIGVLSTFMIADEVQILTVHPDDDFARRLTLPSVVKSYLIKKIAKDSPEVERIGRHGTEVTLQIRRSAELGKVEALVRYWMVLPGCELYCKIDESDPVAIGFPDTKAVVDYYYQQETKNDARKRLVDLRIESLPGVDLAFVVRKSILTDVWDFAQSYDNDNNPADFLNKPPGICVEGIRVRSTPAGYDTRNQAPWIFANLTGPCAPKTNVARSDVEQTPEFENALFQIYSLIGKHIQNEFDHLLKKSIGIAEAAWEADFIRRFGLETASPSNQNKFEEAMDNLRMIALEDEKSCRVVSKQELDSIGAIWTADSRLIRNIEGMSGTLGIDLPTETIVEKLGKCIAPPIPMPRVIGNSYYPLRGMEITKIRIYPEERTHRVDICWEKEKPKRWFKLSEDLAEIVRRHSRYSSGVRHIDKVWIALDKNISAECPDCDVVVWRNRYLVLSSGIQYLLKALGETENFARWLGMLIIYGQIPLNQRPILKEELVQTIGKRGEELLEQLVLPFERRFGGAREEGEFRNFHFFSNDW